MRRYYLLYMSEFEAMDRAEYLPPGNNWTKMWECISGPCQYYLRSSLRKVIKSASRNFNWPGLKGFGVCKKVSNP